LKSQRVISSQLVTSISERIFSHCWQLFFFQRVIKSYGTPLLKRIGYDKIKIEDWINYTLQMILFTRGQLDVAAVQYIYLSSLQKVEP